MGDLTKIVDKCKRCRVKLTEEEDIFCTACLKADSDAEEAEDKAKEGPPEEDSKAPRPLISIFLHDTHGPTIVIDDKQNVTPMLALELLLYAVEDLKMNLTAARVAQNIATMSRDEKTFKRLFRGAAKKITVPEKDE